MSELYAKNPKVEVAPMRDECVLFNPDNNKFCLLNRTAALLWQKLDSPKTADQLADLLTEHFTGVERSVAVQDVRSAFRDLVNTDCVTSS